MTPLQKKETEDTKARIKKLLTEKNHLARLFKSAIAHKAPEYSIKAVDLQLQAIQKQIDTEIEYLDYLVQQIENNLKEAV